MRSSKLPAAPLLSIIGLWDDSIVEADQRYNQPNEGKKRPKRSQSDGKCQVIICHLGPFLVIFLVGWIVLPGNDVFYDSPPSKQVSLFNERFTPAVLDTRKDAR